MAGDVLPAASGVSLPMDAAASVSQDGGACSVPGEVPKEESARKSPLLHQQSGVSAGETSPGGATQSTETAQRCLTTCQLLLTQCLHCGAVNYYWDSFFVFCRITTREDEIQSHTYQEKQKKGKRRTLATLHVDIIRNHFWNVHPDVLAL